MNETPKLFVDHWQLYDQPFEPIEEPLDFPVWINHPTQFIDTANPESHPSRSRHSPIRFIGGIVVSIWMGVSSGALIGSYLDHAINEQPELVENAANVTEVPLKHLEDISQVSVGAEVAKDLHSATYKLSTEKSMCTGTLINGQLLTAGHCVATEEKLRIYSPDFDERLELVAQSVSYAWQYGSEATPRIDAAIGKVEPYAAFTQLEDIQLNGTSPDMGTRFIISSMPGDDTDPTTSELTYIGTLDDGQMYFLLDLNSEYAEACKPGASGSAITDGNNRFAVLGTGFSSDTPNARHVESVTGVRIEQHHYVCGGTQITPELWGSYINELSKAND